MPRLPDFREVGVNNPRATYQIPTYVAEDHVAKAQGQIGTALQSLGNAIAGPVATAIDQQNEKAGALQEAQATSYYQTEKIKLGQAIKDETDPDKVKELTKQHDDLLNQSAGIITDPKRQEKWKLARIPDTATVQGAAGDREFALRKDQALASSFDQLTKLQQTAASATDDKDRESAISAGKGLIDKLEEAGYIDSDTAAKRRQSWASGYAVQAFQRLSPQDRLVALTPVQTDERTKQAFDFFRGKGWTPEQAAGLVGNLIHESGLRTDARNSGDGTDGSDSIGIGQWNSQRAAALKAFAAARGTSVTDFTTQLEFVQNELQGSEKAAGDALREAKTVQEATGAVVTKYERPAGSNRGAEASHGWTNRLKQANGTFSAGLGRPVVASSGEPLLQFMTPQQQEQARRQAEADYTREERANAAALRNEQAEVKALQTDDWNSITTTGKPLSDLTPERVEAAQGPDARADFEASRERAQRYYQATNDFDTIPAQEIERRVDSLKPRPGVKGFTADQKIYDAAKSQAETIVQQRQRDPAAAVDNLPDVKAARQGASLDNPESFRPLARARLIAQERLQIPEDLRSPITRDEAKALYDPIATAPDADKRDVIADTIKQLDAAFGDDADDVLARVLQIGRADKVTRQLAASVFRKLSQGDVPTPAQAQAIDQSTQQAAADAALAAVSALPAFGDVTGLGGNQSIQPSQTETSVAPARRYPVPTADHIQRLAADPTPEMIAAFNREDRYGPGAAERVLGAMKVKPRGR